jgi:glycosyltransferase involved in cell wall biosynthesis
MDGRASPESLLRRVAVNASVLGDRPTGLGIYAVNLIQELAALHPGLLVYTSTDRDLPRDLIEVRRIPTAVRPERGMLGHAARLLWLQQAALTGRIRRDGVTLLINLVPEGFLLGGFPQATVVHDLLPLRYPEEYPRHQYYFRLLVPWVLGASRVVIADSENTRRDIERAYRIPAHRVRVVPAGYNEHVFHPGRPGVGPGVAEDPPFVLFVGNILPHKNLLRLLDAFTLVTRRVACRLVIRGDGHPVHVREIRDRVETLECRDRIEFRPYVSMEDLGALYRAARLVVLPSLYEGFGLTALEAMACGTPVVASNTSSIPEVAGDAALLVDPTDAVEMADAIHRGLTDDRLRTELTRRGLARARLFSWQRTAKELLAAVAESAAAPDERDIRSA